jgi:hypothetical protein
MKASCSGAETCKHHRERKFCNLKEKGANQIVAMTSLKERAPRKPPQTTPVRASKIV